VGGLSAAAHDPVREAVLRWLDRLDVAADDGDPGTLLPLARREINRLAEGWRLLLTVHQSDDEGRCQACPTGTRGRWPCQIWRMAHEQLIGEGVPHDRRTGPLHNPLGRASRALAARRSARPDPPGD